MTYQEWVDELLPRNPAGMCGAVTQAMVEDFPELRRVRGHFVAADGRQYPHWWCETPGGDIVDPTVAQFGGMPGDYVEHVGPEPTGKCLNCGGYVYTGDHCCSETCLRTFAGAEAPHP